VFIRADRNKIYQDRDDIVFTSSGQLVVLDDRYRERVGLLAMLPDAKSPAITVDIMKVVRAVLTIGEALVSNNWTQNSTKWTQAGLFKVAFALVDIFGPTAPAKDTLDIEGVTGAVQNLIDQNEARLQVPPIFLTLAWLNKYIGKSRLLAQGGVDPSTIELSAYDRAQFIDELNKHVDGNTGFKGAIATLRDNRAIRKHVIPSYLLGAMLDLHLEVLSLCVKRETSPLDVADIESVVHLGESYASTLGQLEEDYAAFCRGWASEYPLLSGLENVGHTDIVIIAAPEPVEGLALGRAAVVKWLQGNRMVIAETALKINQFVNALKGMKVGV
jgi:hypothetical protein